MTCIIVIIFFDQDQYSAATVHHLIHCVPHTATVYWRIIGSVLVYFCPGVGDDDYGRLVAI